MKHAQRVELYRAYLAAEGTPPQHAVPPVWSLLWASGIELPPPPFLGALPLALMYAPMFASIPIVLWVFDHLRFHRHHLPWSWVLWLMAAAALAGAIGPPMFYRRMARRYGLLRWSTFYGLRQH